MPSPSLRRTNLLIVLLSLGNARCGATDGSAHVRDDAGHAEAAAPDGHAEAAAPAGHAEAAAPDGHAEAAAPAACNPLAPPPITLGTVIGLGEGPAPATTIYVVDTAPEPGLLGGVMRVFASSGKTLHRKYVDGSGSSESQYSFTFDDSATEPFSDARDLLLQVEGRSATRMALAPSNARDGFAPDSGDLPLALLDGGAIKGFSITNLPNVVSYVADASNGDSVILVSAMDEETMADEHIFYGKPSQMREAPLVSDDRDCCEVLLTFTVNGAKVEANFVFSQGGAFTTSSLNTGAGTFGLKVRNPTPTNLDGFSFECDGN